MKKVFKDGIKKVVCDFVTKSLKVFKSGKMLWPLVKGEISHSPFFSLNLILWKKFSANFITV